MSEDEIKPCPFCGVVPEQYRDRQFEDWVIYCGNDDCPIEVDVRDSEPAQAITAWNTRAGEQAAYERGKAKGAREERARCVAGINRLITEYIKSPGIGFSHTMTAKMALEDARDNIVNQE